MINLQTTKQNLVLTLCESVLTLVNFCLRSLSNALIPIGLCHTLMVLSEKPDDASSRESGLHAKQFIVSIK